MTVQSRPLVNGEVTEVARARSLSINHLIAAVLWVAACVTTWQLLAAVTPGADWRYQIAAGIVLQAIFTAMERPVLRGRPNRVSTLVLLLDTLINAGGLYPYAARIGATPTAAMVSTAFNMPAQVSPVAAFVLAVLIGFLLAAAPEAVWRWRS